MKIGHFVLFAGFVVLFLGISALPIMPKSIKLGTDLGLAGIMMMAYGLITLYFGKKSITLSTEERSNPVLDSWKRRT